MPRVYDNGSGATLLQSANRPVLVTALVTCKPVKASAGPVFGFSTSTAMKAMHNLLASVRAALLTVGAGK